MSLIDHILSLALPQRLAVLGYLTAMAMLAVYGLHRYTLVVAARRSTSTQLDPALPAGLPMVTVQLPIFNEIHVVERLLDSVAEMDWPADRLEIQVLDDSTDATPRLVAGRLEGLRRRGLTVSHLHRSRRSGFKAGALAAGLQSAVGEFIVVFDADFVAPRDLLRRTIGHFFGPGNHDVAMVQVRWEHINRRASLLTRLQALALDGHFWIDQAARASRGHFFNFNGTAGIWRRTAIDDAGGWNDDTLTEDLDLSYRAQLAGYRFIYRSDVTAPAELPESLNAYKSQQHRWAKGSAQTAVKLLPRLLRAEIPRRVKLEAIFHLTGNFAYPLLLLVALLAGPALEHRYRLGWDQTLLFDLPFFLLGTMSVGWFYARAIGRDHRAFGWALLAPLIALGIGMTVNNSRAVIAGLIGHRSEFRRTPKSGRTGARPGYRVAIQGWFLVEAALGLHFVSVTGHAIAAGLWLSVPFLALFAGGFLTTAALSVVATLRELRPANHNPTLDGSEAVSGALSS